MSSLHEPLPWAKLSMTLSSSSINGSESNPSMVSISSCVICDYLSSEGFKGGCLALGSIRQVDTHPLIMLITLDCILSLR